jgi:hypothetical protein
VTIEGMAPNPSRLDHESELSSPVRDLLAVVPDAPIVYLSFADSVGLRRTGPVWRRRLRRFPAGLVHAAEPRSQETLCGAPVNRLEAFGRSRHPFERFAETERCTDCHVAAGRPIG